MRIVLDTNVLVSAFLKPHSDVARILGLILQGEIELIVDSRILDEYREVLYRPKFKFDQKKIKVVLDLLRLRAMRSLSLAKPTQLPDKDDTPFLEAALSRKADCIVTGNKKHFPKKFNKSVKVLTPYEFLEALKNGYN